MPPAGKPEDFVAAMLRDGLDTRTVGHPVLLHPELDSTMDEVARLSDGGAKEGTVVVAEVQTAGRGRFGRTWVSPEGNLWVSILLRPSLDSLRWLSVLAGIAAARAIASAAGLEVTLKWPNDVRIRGRKVGGVLVENSLSGSEVRHAIIGIGINVALDTSTDFHLASTATALNRECEGPVSRAALLRHLLEEVDRLYESLMAGETPLEEWRGLLDTLGKEVVVRDVTGSDSLDGSYRGVAEDVDVSGNLLLRLPDGGLITLAGGEVTILEAPAFVYIKPGQPRR